MRNIQLIIILLLGGLQPAFSQYTNIKTWSESQLLASKALKQANVGISIYEPATNKYWYNYQSDHFFTPASNMKIFSLYTGMLLLGDSLPAIKYLETDSVLYIQGTADPAFLHKDFTYQPAFQLLLQTNKKIVLIPANTQIPRFGNGWSWNDYADYYQSELNDFPMYGNVARLRHHGDSIYIVPKMYNLTSYQDPKLSNLEVKRDERTNNFSIGYNKNILNAQEEEVPFITGTTADLVRRLQDTLHKEVSIASQPVTGLQTMKGIPADSLFRPMMHRSDNFFAEQTLLMSAGRLFDTVSTTHMISYMLDHYLSGLPDTPVWVDGSGLSRYNLFSPRDFVYVLAAMYKAYPTERLYNLFATGGKGTLKNYYKEQFVHAKTGTLTGVVALSGYLVTKKKKTLVFSVLVNNHNNSASTVRREVERFLTQVYENY
jgi:D-alanyl-D-alanine carboxypeptidase/D-alanyl-D-alanine-endopeptidase (penicillin-binding protein 4)